ncbi:MAG TPA: Ig-like domain-containing protein, partial [Ilumatobacteraceae bacterium]|nr:Ig-like domain-containing protein [Ilumatobacteraceae bacterium]
MRTEVESGKAVAYDVLADWWDPDGDDLQLLGATTAGKGAVSYSPGGVVRYEAFGVSSGVETITVRVSDGHAQNSEANAELSVTVKPQGQPIKPNAKDDFVTVLEGRTASVQLLVNDSDGNFKPGDPNARLTASLGDLSQLPGGITATYAASTDTLTVTGVTPGVYAVPYTASDGTDTDTAIVRVEVLATPAVNQPPLAVPDRVVLRPGRIVNVDVLTNDVDLDGDIVAVVSANAPTFEPAAGGVRATVIDRRLVQVELVAPTGTDALRGPFTISYTIDDGNGTGDVSHRSIGALTVLVDNSIHDQAPVMVSDNLRVRTGDIGRVAVLANDSDPDGDKIELTGLDPVDVTTFTTRGGGVAWVDKQTVRVRGGTPGQYVLHYTVVANGRAASGELNVTVTPDPTESSLNQAPTPRTVEVRVGRGNTTRIKVPLDDIDPDGDSVAIESVSLTEQGTAGTTVSIDPGDPTRLLYTTSPVGATARDSFTYQVTDRLGQGATGTVQVLIVDVEPSAPVAHDDVMRARPGRVVLVPVVSNDSDADDDPIALAELPFVDGEGQPTATPANPDLVDVVRDVEGGLVTGGRLQVEVPAVGQPAVHERYRVTDPAGNVSNPANVSVIPDPEAPNLAPIAGTHVVEAGEVRGLDEITVDLSLDVSDPDDALGKLQIGLPDAVAMPGVQARVDGGAVVVTLTESAQRVIYTVTDADPDNPLTSHGIIEVPGKQNHAPVLQQWVTVAGAIETESSPVTPITLRLSEIVEDPDGDTGIVLTATPVDGGGYDVRRSDDNLSFTFTPSESTIAYDVPIQFEVEDRPGDRTSLRATLTVTVHVTPGNTPPVFQGAGQVQLPQYREPVTYSLAGLMRDADGDLLTYVLTNVDELRGITVNQDGDSITLEGTDSSIAPGQSYTLLFTATDGIGEHQPVDGQVRITIVTTNKGEPVAQDFPNLTAVRDEPANPVDVIAAAVNPHASTGDPLRLQSVRVTGAASLNCTTACGQQPIVFTASQPGTFTVTYVIEDVVGNTATGTLTYLVRGRPLVPGTPEVTSVGDRTVNLSWSAADDQGSPITKYVVRAVEAGITHETTTTSIAFDGLTN